MILSNSMTYLFSDSVHIVMWRCGGRSILIWRQTLLRSGAGTVSILQVLPHLLLVPVQEVLALHGRGGGQAGGLAGLVLHLLGQTSQVLSLSLNSILVRLNYVIIKFILVMSLLMPLTSCDNSLWDGGEGCLM